MAKPFRSTRLPLASMLISLLPASVLAQDLKLADARSDAQARCEQKLGQGAVAEEELDFGEVSYICNCRDPYKWNDSNTRCVSAQSTRSALPDGEGKLPENAQSELELWLRARDSSGLFAVKRYLKLYPHGTYASLARSKIAAWEQQNSSGKKPDLAAANKAYEDAKKVNTIEALEKFASQFPNTIYTRSAHLRISEIKSHCGEGAIKVSPDVEAKIPILEKPSWIICPPNEKN
ncbi:MAG: hypothetical protein GY947_19790 [Rhodobacteraceae bacterium]|nr:hypothetical protein [Paracoccaceae bacterium]